MAEDGGRRLDSWKEIAEYLGRDVTTVIRWEKERGLPVRRVPGGRRRVVLAYTSEIDAWLAGAEPNGALPAMVVASPVATGPSDAFGPGRPSPNGPASDKAPSVVPAQPQPQSVRRRLFPLTAAAILVLVLSSLIFVRVVRPHWMRTSPVASLTFGPHDVTAWGERKEPRWTYTTTARVDTEVMDRQGFPRWAVADFGHDGSADVVAALSYGEDRRLKEEVICFSASGQPRWRRELTDELSFGAGRFGPPWYGGSVVAYNVSNETRIAWAQNHYTSWPSILEILDGSGKLRGRFVHSGQIQRLATTESSSGPLILGGGISAANQAAMMFVLDGSDVSGTGPEGAGSPYACVGCPPGRPLRYFVFPPSELINAQGEAHNRFQGLRQEGHGVEVQTWEGGEANTGGSAAIFTFSRDLRLEHMAFSDGYSSQHDRLWRGGRLDHPWEKCPHRVPTVRAWDPAHGWTDVTQAR